MSEAGWRWGVCTAMMRERNRVKADAGHVCVFATGRCNFPLLNGPIIEEPRLEEEDNAAITCKVCGMRHSISSGKVSRASHLGAPYTQA